MNDLVPKSAPQILKNFIANFMCVFDEIAILFWCLFTLTLFKFYPDFFFLKNSNDENQ